MLRSAAICNVVLPIFPLFLPPHRSDHNEFTPLEIDSAATETLSFTQHIPIVLDAVHHSSFGALGTPYQWFMREVAADASGRLLGVIAVSLTGHEQTGVALPLVEVDPSTGPQLRGERTVTPSFPFVPETTLLWALVDLQTRQVVASTAEPVVRVFTREDQEGPLVVARHLFIRREGGPQPGVAEAGWSEDGGRRASWVAVGEPTELSTLEGISELSIEGQWRAELGEALKRLGLTPAETFGRRTLRDVPFGCDGQDAGIASCRVIRVAVFRSDAARTIQLETARRARPAPAPGAERLVFLVAGGTLLVWDPFTPSARAALDGSRGVIEFLGAATRAAILATSFSLETFQLSSLVVPLEGAGGPIVFPGENLRSSFRLLDPSRLYHVEEMKFYRLQAPLERTALPADLAPLPGDPRGDYHVIQLPQ